MSNRIEKSIEIKAPVSRVWHALTNYQEFGEWFQVKLEQPFVLGQLTTGQLTYPGYEHVKLEMIVKKIEPENFFSFTWHPYAVDTNRDYSKETPTLVEFQLKKIENGTFLLVIESGFDKIPADRRFEAFRMHENGWEEQLNNIKDYAEKSS